MYSNNNIMPNYGFAGHQTEQSRYQPAGPLSPLINFQPQYNYSPMQSNYSPGYPQNKSFNSSGYYSSSSENSFLGSPANFNYYTPYGYSTQLPTYQGIAPYSSQSLFTEKPTIPVYQKDTPERAASKRPRADTENLIDEIFQVCGDANPKNKRVKTDAEVLPEPPMRQAEDELDDSCDLSMFDSNGKKRILTKEQRKAANQRERKRMNIMNDAFTGLRSALPISTGRKRRKMSRLDIVIGAMEYIDYLNSLLETPGNGPIEINFEAYQNTLYEYFQDSL